MSSKPKILLVGDLKGRNDSFGQYLNDHFEVVAVTSDLRALAHLRRDSYDGVYITDDHVVGLKHLGRLIQNEQVLSGMSDGVVLLDAENKIVWHNECMQEWCNKGVLVGDNFYNVLSSPEILGPDFCPLHTALSSGIASNSMLRTADNRYFHIHAAPVF